MDRTRMQEALILAGGVTILSSGSIFAILAGQPPLVTAFLRCLLAGLPLLAWAGFKGDLQKMTRREALFGVASGLFLAIHLGAWFASLGLVSVAMSLVLLSTAPLWSIFLGAVFKIDPFHKGQAWAALLSFGGILIIAASSWSSPGTIIGGAFALLSGLAMACYTLCARARDRSKGLAGFAAASYLSSASFLLLASAIIGGLAGPSSTEAFLWILAMTVCSQLIGHTTVNWAAGRMRAVTVGQMLLLEPVIATILAWIVFRQSVGPWLAVGGVIVLIGAVLSINLSEDSPNAPLPENVV